MPELDLEGAGHLVIMGVLKPFDLRLLGKRLLSEKKGKSYFSSH